MAKKNHYKVEFSVDNLTLVEQDKLFKTLIKELDYDGRMALHVTVTDALGGKHFVWDNTGIDPNGTKCDKCKLVDCNGCAMYKMREEIKNGK